MLTLTRRPDESIIIHTANGPIEVVVTQIKGNQVRLGITAPPEVSIVREELERDWSGRSLCPMISTEM